MPSSIRITKIGFVVVVSSLLLIWATNFVVEKFVSDKVFNSTTEIPYNKVGVLLGTGKYLSNGRVNLYYSYRIEAAEQLFKSGKVSFILISGDNSTENYDEPTTMKNDLIEKGIPEAKIYLDYAGFRTLDSVVRCKEIFEQESITVLSQRFHNERAIFIANWKGINAVGYNAQDVNVHYGIKTMLREKLARVKMLLDLGLGKEPKFLGEKVVIK